MKAAIDSMLKRAHGVSSPEIEWVKYGHVQNYDAPPAGATPRCATARVRLVQGDAVGELNHATTRQLTTWGVRLIDRVIDSTLILDYDGLTLENVLNKGTQAEGMVRGRRSLIPVSAFSKQNAL